MSSVEKPQHSSLPRITIQDESQQTGSPIDSPNTNDPTTSPTTLLAASPPSPTLSTQSIRFNTSKDLRQNNPTFQSGAATLALLGPASSSHSRKPSVSTNPDTEIPLSPVPSSMAITRDDQDSLEGATQVPPTSSVEKSNKKPILETEDVTDPSPYAFSPNRIAALVANNAKDFSALEGMGGIDGLLNGLGTNRSTGLSSAALSTVEEDAPPPPHSDGKDTVFSTPLTTRMRIYGTNVLPTRASKTLLRLMWEALQDKVLVLLIIAAAVSLALGLYSDFGVKKEPVACPDTGLFQCFEPSVDWVEGVAILIAVLIVVLVGSLNDWQKERQFRALNDKKEDRTVKVIRNGQEQIINVKDIVVGDIAIVEPGEILPVDGVFLGGHNVVCDEAGATGESKTIKKISYEDVAERKRTGSKHPKGDCFLISGSKVQEGVGQYVVIAVGPRSFNGKILMDLRGETEDTPLQIKLNALAELIAKLGLIAGCVLFGALMIRFFVHLKTDPSRSANTKAMEFVQILIIAVTIIVVAVPEGLPLAVTLALAFATKRMTSENLLVRVLGSCEIMANASVVCTDKTGTLTTNVMTVVAGSIGVHAKFTKGDRDGDKESAEVRKENETRQRSDFSLDVSEINKRLDTSLKDLFNDAIVINSTAFEDINQNTKLPEFVGSKTETALLQFAKDLGWKNYRERRNAVEVLQMIPFSSEQKCMGVVVKADGHIRLFLKGASEILVDRCTKHIAVHKDASSKPTYSTSGGIEVTDITRPERENIDRTIIFYANQSLRTIALCYKDFESWPPKNATFEGDKVTLNFLSTDLTLIAVTAIEDPLREGVKQAVEDCKRAGVSVRMCTGDNILTARSIAYQCGIFTPGGVIMSGPTFRNLTDAERTEIVPRLQVLARSSPQDKKILVEKLRSLGETVGVTGDGTNDGPALKMADVGFSMGITGTEVAKEASDIILMDDNFASIVSAIIWGRAVNDAVRKFLQFQVSVNITAVIITFVSAVASTSESSVLTAVQLLWINIIMDTFAALALATDPATRESLDRKPDRKTAPLFTTPMLMQIFGQSMYQTFIILLFHFGGNMIFGYHTSTHTEAQIQQWESEVNTLVFNAFVFCQIFNSFNARRIDMRKNIFAGITKNYYFIVITLIEIAAQIIIVFVGGAAFSVHTLSGRSWGISIALGFMSIPIGFLIRCIPEEPVDRFFRKMKIIQDKSLLTSTSPEADKQAYDVDAINTVRDNLKTFSNIRGGRVRSSSFVRKSRAARLQEAGVQIPSLLAMVPTLVMSSIGAGWKPHPGSMGDPSAHDPSQSSAALYAGNLMMHPDTAKDDALYKKYCLDAGSAPIEEHDD